MSIDWKKNIEQMQENYQRKPLRFKHLPKPKWMRETDPIYQVYRDKKMLMKYGKVYYAAVVQANQLLFEKDSKENCPGNIVYSTHPFMKENPLLLSQLAHELFAYKGMPLEKVPAQYREIVRIITDEMDRSGVNFHTYLDKYTSIDQMQNSDIGNMEDWRELTIKFLALMVFRNDLPQNYLGCNLLPILAAPNVCQSVLILPKQYWTDEFLKWSYGL
ncbi:MAG: hypothetical protein Q4D51_07385 [Eubacteriales bacterium]|nr:hypothetical protein [Eubacteriales bacterium]